MTAVRAFLSEDDAVAALEYALLAGLIAAAMAGAAWWVGIRLLINFWIIGIVMA